MSLKSKIKKIMNLLETEKVNFIEMFIFCQTTNTWDTFSQILLLSLFFFMNGTVKYHDVIVLLEKKGTNKKIGKMNMIQTQNTQHLGKKLFL